MSIPRYIVPDDQLVDESLLGGRLYNDTTAVVKEADAIELARRTVEEALKNERKRITVAVKERMATEPDIPRRTGMGYTLEIIGGSE